MTAWRRHSIAWQSAGMERRRTSLRVFWLKNRRKDRWRDVQNIESEIGHYIISDRPMTEQEWIEQRATLATPVQHTRQRLSSRDADM